MRWLQKKLSSRAVCDQPEKACQTCPLVGSFDWP